MNILTFLTGCVFGVLYVIELQTHPISAAYDLVAMIALM